MTKEALKLALEALEGVLDDAPKVLDASIAGGLYEVVQCRDAITAIKEALAQPEPEYLAFMDTPQRTWVGLTPACPSGLTQYECEVEGVDLVCFLEYTPDEEGSRDSYGLLNEPGTSENLELVNAYVKGTDVDIGHLLLQYLVDHITTTALEDFKNDDY